jgi:hypothetical protein
MSERAPRIAALVAAVVQQTLAATGREAVVILDDWSPEASLAADWCALAIGEANVVRATLDGLDPGLVPEEVLRGHARALARQRNALTAHAANKTTLLLTRDFPPEPLLPLGDLYASQVATLAGGWSGPAWVRSLARSAGGIEAIDHALMLHCEGWNRADEAAAHLPEEARGPFLEALRAGRFWREHAGLIPKLSGRTIGIDLFG